MMMEQTWHAETSAYKIQTPGNHPKERIQHSEQSENLKSSNIPNQNYQHFLCNGTLTFRLGRNFGSQLSSPYASHCIN